MDEYSTPIEQLRPDMNDQQQNPVNYADMLQTMERSQAPVQQMQPQMHEQPQYPPPPMVQSRAPTNPHTGFVTQNTKQPEEIEQSPNFQKEFIYLFLPAVVLYSNPVQAQLLNAIPSLFRDEKPTILGNIFNAGIITLIFILMKNMKVKFN